MIDQLNLKIIHCLEREARMSVAAIARTVGITAPAVAERIRKMEDAGLILGYHARVDHLKMGNQLKAIITLKAFMGKLKPFLAEVTKWQEVINCYRITGNENIVMEVVLRNQAHLEEFIDKIISYGESKTQIVLSHVVAHSPLSRSASK